MPRCGLIRNGALRLRLRVGSVACMGLSDDEVREHEDWVRRTTDAEKGPLDDRLMQPNELDASQYVELGAVEVSEGPDGLPVIGGNPRPSALGLFVESFVCNAAPADGERPERPKCDHLAQLVTDFPGDFVDQPLSERPKRILRWCLKIASTTEPMDLRDQNIYACELRSPPDSTSSRLIERVEAHQRAVALEGKTKSKTFEV